jgi:hypothetical protein
MALREIIAKFGVEVDTKQFTHAKEEIDSLGEGFEKLVQSFAKAVVIKQVSEFFTSAIEEGAKLNDMSDRLGISSDKLQEYGFIAEQSGVSIEEFAGSIQKFYKAAGGDQATKGASASLTKLGVAMKDGAGKAKSFDDVLPDIAEGIKKLPEGAERATAAQNLFGRSGMKLLPLLVQGKEGIDQLHERYLELGGSVEDFGTKSDEADDAIQQSKFALTQLRNQIAVGAMPIIAALARGLATFVGWIRRTPEAMALMQAGIAVLVIAAGALTVAFIKQAAAMIAANAVFLLAAAAIALVGLAVYDLYNLANGKGSKIGDLLDAIFGKGARDVFAKGLIAAWEYWTELAIDTASTLLAFAYILQDAWVDMIDGIVDAWDWVDATIAIVMARAAMEWAIFKADTIASIKSIAAVFDEGLGLQIKDTFTDTVNYIKSLFRVAVDFIVNEIERIVDAIPPEIRFAARQGMKGAGEFIGGAATDGGNYASSLFGSAAGSVSRAVGSAPTLEDMGADKPWLEALQKSLGVGVGFITASPSGYGASSAQVPLPGAAKAGSVDARTTSMVNNLTINTDSSKPKEIAEETGSVLRSTMAALQRY